MEELELFGQNFEIKPITNAANGDDRNIVNDLGDLGNAEITSALFRQSGGFASDCINVLVPVFTIFKRDQTDVRQYAIVAVAKFDKNSTAANKLFKGFSYTGTSALFNRSYQYEDKVNKANPIEYTETRFGTPLIGTFNESRGEKMNMLAKDFTAFLPKDTKRPEIRTNFDEKSNKVLFIDKDGKPCPETERQCFKVYESFTFTEAEKQQLIKGAEMYFGGQKKEAEAQPKQANRRKQA